MLDSDVDRVVASRVSAGEEGLSISSLLDRVGRRGGQKSFGWCSLDELEIGFNAGELAVIAGRTGHGKSTVLLNLLLHWLDSYPDQRFVLYSYEIPPEAVLLKLLSTVSRKSGSVGWTYHDVRRWVQDPSGRLVPPGLDVKEIHEAIAKAESWQNRLFVIYEPEWTVNQLADHARCLSVETGGVHGIMVDYLQLVLPPPGRYEGREQEVTAVARELKRLSVMAGAPVVAAAQIGREAARAADSIPDGTLEDDRVLKAIAKRRPQLHHLREGGGEQEADLVLGLLNYRADFLAAREEAGVEKALLRELGAAGPFDLAVIKNRYGQLGVASLVLESRAGYIRDAGVFGR